MAQQTWLITGVGGGFGRHLTEQLLDRGDRVAGTVRDLDRMTALKAKYGDRLWLAHLDVTDFAEIKQVVNRAFAAFGRIDVVVNNAGYGLFGAAEEFTDEEVHHELDTNLVGPIEVTRAALPFLRTQGAGRIIQMSTYGGQATNPGATIYHASEWGIEGFMESLAREVEVFGIGVTIVEPGGARTEFRYGSSRLATPLSAYDNTPGAMTRMIKNLPPAAGDPAKMAEAIIASVDSSPAPRRLVLGSDGYKYIHDALLERLAEVEAQETSAATTDAPLPEQATR
ncbi:SDR family oxidoreductase [Actinoplanes sp. TBRC 11911]|uniref:SDR family oxidoreductase n=1 Tax=Actinoplanes sp. TBRC 11911 TaxID=2729386 RepID=UPI00145E0D30|nr:SDR family oxidoreductase [Actinoplanes sp. TBRC 11911]NMO50027.1 SDR family oxidoreductase [Actinoplanes sp. TBRC 11911]